MIRTLLLSALLLLSAATPASAQNRNLRLQAIFDAYERLDRRVDPLTSSSEGEREALRRLPDATREAELAWRAELNGIKSQLERIDERRLNAEDRLNRAYLLRVIAQRMTAIDLDTGRMPIDNGGGFFTLASYLAYVTPITSREDAEAWIARVEALPLWYRQNLVNARRGVADGFTQPRIVAERALNVARNQVDTLEATLLHPFGSMPASIPEAEQEAYRGRVRAIVRDQIMPEHRATIAFLETEYLPAARPELALSSLPNGRAYYSYLVGFHTTTDLTPEQIHEIGLDEVARIRAAMEREIAASGFEGSFADFQRVLRTDPRFYATSPDDLVARASEVAKRADGQLPRIFGTLPRLPYDVRVIPAESAEGSTTAYYTQGSAALGQAGTYWVNTTHLDQRPLYELPALTLHEAVPGHHLQIALAQEQSELPYFRRNSFVTAYVEGWGLYAESLGEDMGMYRTPHERFGRYSYEMWRACRLVADTGIHWMGWDIEQARRCFADNTVLSPHNIQTELERYIATPGQALAYKIGELTMQRLRDEAETALGDRFSIRAFHDELLGAGPLPMDVLEARMRAWTEAQRRG